MKGDLQLKSLKLSGRKKPVGDNISLGEGKSVTLKF
jgi:hypothetical protein